MQLALPTAFVNGIGYMAGLLTTIAFVPQVVKAWRSRSTGDLSLAMLTIYTAGILCWLSYGLVLRSTPMILANGATLALNASLMAMKFRTHPDQSRG